MIRLDVYSRGARRRAAIRTWARGRPVGEVRIAFVPSCDEECGETLAPASLSLVDLEDGAEAAAQAIEAAGAAGAEVVAAWSGEEVDRGCEIAALQAGALELVALEDGAGRGLPSLATWLARYAAPRRGKPARPDRQTASSASTASPRAADEVPLVLIASSTGGPQALAEILAGLPADLPAAIAIAQHMDRGHMDGTRSWLAEQTPLRVLVSQRPVVPERGVVYLARGGDHLAVRGGGSLVYTDEPRSASFRPSGDVLFESALRHAQGPLLGIVLTGMGRDGVRGLLALRQAGHRTIAQDERTSALFGMPKAAALAGAAERVCALEEIAGEIAAWVGAPPCACREPVHRFGSKPRG